jgi:hypothetical protein
MYVLALENGRTTESCRGEFELNSEQLLKQSCVRRKPLNLMAVMIFCDVLYLHSKMVVRPNHVSENWNKLVNNYWNRVTFDGNPWISRQSWYFVMQVLAHEDGLKIESYSGEFEYISKQLMKQRCVRRQLLNLTPFLIFCDVYICNWNGRRTETSSG